MIGAQSAALAPVLIKIKVGQYDYLDSRIAGFDFLEQINTAAAGHPNIENDRIGFQAPYRIQAFAGCT